MTNFVELRPREFTLGVAGAGKNWDPINLVKLQFATSHDRFHPKEVANRKGNTIISGTSRFVRFFLIWPGISLLLGGWVPRTCFGDTVLLPTMVSRKCPKDRGWFPSKWPI